MKLRRTPALIAAGTVITLVGVFVADVAVEHSAQDRIARAAGCRLQARGPVTAELSGAFAGLRALTGQVGSVHLAAEGVRRADTDMDIKADLYDVTRDGGISGGRATATIPYEALQKRLADSEEAAAGAEGLTVGGDAKGLTLTGTVGTLGLPVTVHATTSTTAAGLTITPTTVTVLGRELPIATVSGLPGAAGLAERLAPRTVEVGDLPEGVSLTGARTTGAGLSLDASLAKSAASDTDGKDCEAA
ncbi:LmeA family phospholipid-binding protein [Streptomyces sp. NPDC006487]|uniref:LmeA family phospholipid-binding protein n=1 Tax=Streptomyces sp. NPDC006487 TaxID=3364748 RepID=UPI0036B1F7A4